MTLVIAQGFFFHEAWIESCMGITTINRRREASSSQRIARLLKRAFCSPLGKLRPRLQLLNRLLIPNKLCLQFCGLLRRANALRPWALQPQDAPRYQATSLAQRVSVV